MRLLRHTVRTQSRPGGHARAYGSESEPVTAPIAFALCYEEISTNCKEDRNVHQYDDTGCCKHLIKPEVSSASIFLRNAISRNEPARNAVLLSRRRMRW